MSTCGSTYLNRVEPDVCHAPYVCNKTLTGRLFKDKESGASLQLVLVYSYHSRQRSINLSMQ